MHAHERSCSLWLLPLSDPVLYLAIISVQHFISLFRSSAPTAPPHVTALGLLKSKQHKLFIETALQHWPCLCAMLQRKAFLFWGSSSSAAAPSHKTAPGCWGKLFHPAHSSVGTYLGAAQEAGKQGSDRQTHARARVIYLRSWGRCAGEEVPPTAGHCRGLQPHLGEHARPVFVPPHPRSPHGNGMEWCGT